MEFLKGRDIEVEGMKGEYREGEGIEKKNRKNQKK